MRLTQYEKGNKGDKTDFVVSKKLINKHKYVYRPMCVTERAESKLSLTPMKTGTIRAD